MKKYKGWEIAKLISEGKLEGRTIQKVTNSHGIACKELNMFFNVSSEMVFHKSGDEGGSSFLTNGKVEYILPQEPVSFTDCVVNEGRVRVEHELTNKVMVDGCYYNEECMPFDHLMLNLSSDLNGAELRTVIKEGKWYLEEAGYGEMQDL